jgi:hypothetical protein
MLKGMMGKGLKIREMYSGMKIFEISLLQL